MLATIQNVLSPVLRPRALSQDVLSTDTAAIRKWRDDSARTFAELIPQGSSYAATAGVLGAFINLIGNLRDIDSVKSLGKDLAITGFAVLGGLVLHALGGRQIKTEQPKLNENKQDLSVSDELEPFDDVMEKLMGPDYVEPELPQPSHTHKKEEQQPAKERKAS